LYANVKVSGEFAKTLLSRGWSRELQDANKLYSAAILLFAIKKHGALLKEDIDTGAECDYSSKDPLPVFQVSLSYWLMYQNSERKTPQKLQTTARRIGQLLASEDERLEDGIRELEGWPNNYSEYTSRDVLVETIEGLLQLEPLLLPVFQESGAIFNVVRGNKITLKPRSLLSYLVVLDRYTQAY